MSGKLSESLKKRIKENLSEVLEEREELQELTPGSDREEFHAGVLEMDTDMSPEELKEAVQNLLDEQTMVTHLQECEEAGYHTAVFGPERDPACNPFTGPEAQAFHECWSEGFAAGQEQLQIAQIIVIAKDFTEALNSDNDAEVDEYANELADAIEKLDSMGAIVEFYEQAVLGENDLEEDGVKDGDTDTDAS